MAILTMAAKLSQKVASTVMRVRAPAGTSIPIDVLKNADPGVRRDMEELVMLYRKMQRDTVVAQAISVGLALGTLAYIIEQGRSSCRAARCGLNMDP